MLWNKKDDGGKWEQNVEGEKNVEGERKKKM
jgi:hypothetical protein